MIRQFSKGDDEQLSENFWLREFHCRCKRIECKRTYISEELIQALQDLRGLIGKTSVTNGFRCVAHNKEIGGKRNSQHLIGIAADIKHAQITPEDLAKHAKRIFCFANGGVGIYKWGIHLDVRGQTARWFG